MDTPQHGKVAVIGAGIVGLMAALEIQRTGRQVIVIEPGEPGGRQAASYGNAGWISNYGVMGISAPGLWRKVPGYLMDRSGPFIIRWADLPRLLPWLLQFTWAGRSWKRVERDARVRLHLCRDTVADHKRVAAEVGVSHLIEQKGHLRMYRDRSDYLASHRQWDLYRRLGIKYTELDKNALRQIEPNVSEHYQFAVLFEQGAHATDMKAYQQAIADLIRRRGGEFIRAQVTGLEISRERLKKVKIGATAIECTQAVVTAGIGSKAIAAAAGDRIPLESERGYHVVIADNGGTISRPVMPVDGMMAITPTPQGLRLAGQVELASVDAPPDWRRADILSRFFPRVFRTRVETGQVVDRWMGHRPSTPDGLPCIGPASKCEGLFYGFGHGHSGVAQAPATAKVLAALLDGKQPPFDISALSVRRF